MRIFTNPGSNLTPRALAHYDIALASQHIVVDGESHDTRRNVTQAEVDTWIDRAREFPHVVGATAMGTLDVFVEAAARDREIMGVTTTRKIIQSYQAAESAARTLRLKAAYADVRVSLVDTGTTDVGAGVVCIAAGELARAGRPLGRVAAVCEAMARQGSTSFYVHDLQRLVRGGRAGVVQAWVAEKLDRRPVLTFVDGEIATSETVRTTDAPSEVLCRAALARFGGKRRVWVAIAHGGAPLQAAACLAECRRQFDVAYAFVRPLSPSIYLHAGPRSLLLAVYPVDKLGDELPVPPGDLDA